MTSPWHHRNQHDWQGEGEAPSSPVPTIARRRHIGWLVAAIVAIAVVAIGARWATLPSPVAVVRPYRGDAAELIYATGFVEPRQPVAVAARMTAPVRAVLVREGDRVSKGQALVTLDDSDLRSAFAQAHAQSVGATLAEQRAVTLFSQGWATRADHDIAVANGEAARAAERMAAAKVAQNIVRSGISGIVIRRDVEPGDLAVPTRTLMLLGDPRRSWITATIDERDVPQIRVGEQAFVSSDAWPGRVFKAHVAALTPTGDPEQRAFRARLMLDGDDVLPLGMSLEINIVSRMAKNALLVPNGALVKDVVWTVADGRAQSRRIHIDVAGQDASAVRGLAPDAVLIAAPGTDLHDGKRVTVAKK